MTFLQAYENYIEYLKLYNSEGTVKFTISNFRTIYKVVGDIDVKDVTSALLYRLMRNWEESGLTANTINKRISLVKRILKHNDCLTNDIKKIKKIKEKFVTYGCLNVNELVKLVSIIPKLEIKDQAIISLFLDSGARLTEVSYILLRNVSINDRMIYLEHTKTNKPRNVFFGELTKKILKKYLKKYKPKIFLFENAKGNRMSPDNIHTVFRRVKRLYGFDKLSAHMLRHTLSTELYKNSGDIIFIGEVLGHSDPNTTKRYIHTDALQLRKRYDELLSKGFFSKEESTD